MLSGEMEKGIDFLVSAFRNQSVELPEDKERIDDIHSDPYHRWKDITLKLEAVLRRCLIRRLWDIVEYEKPDLLFSVRFQELDKDVIRMISQETDTITVGWFSDDHWRFDDFTRFWAPQFNWLVTTAQSSLPKYEALGYQNVI